MSGRVIKSFLAATMCLGAPSMAVLPAVAQEGLGTIVTPLEPQRKVGLPDQAPAVEQTPVGPETARPARTAQSATPEPGTDATFADWKMECLPAAAIPCQVVNRALSPDQKQVIMVISMAYAKKSNETQIQMALPLGFAVQAGVSIDVGESYKVVIQVSRCTAQGCLVEWAAAPDMIVAMEKGKIGSVSIQTVEGAKIGLPFSLSGFGEAYNAMKKRNEAAPS